MSFLRKYKNYFLFAGLLIILYFFSRFYNILSLPIFTDEAIYIRWAQIAKNDASWRFISLTDGKQPLFVWIAMIFMKFISDPLLSGRLVSVLSGMLSMLGIFFLGKEVSKSNRVGILSAFLYLIYPFALVYDRMALYDSLLALFSIWSLYFEILLVKSPRLDIALILSMIIGAGLLTKSSAAFFLILLPFSLFLFSLKREGLKQRFARFLILSFVVVILSYFYSSVLRLSPFFHIISEKNALFVYPFSEWITHPFRFFIGNLMGLFNWVFTYFTFPLVLLCAVPFFVNLRKNLGINLLLLSWFIVPITALALFGKVLYPRFILFMTMPLLILAALAFDFIIEKIKSKIIVFALIFLFIFPVLKADYFIVSDFARAPIPRADLEQYINNWPAGGGIRESVVFFREEARKGPIFIGTEGTFGLLPYAYEIYLGSNQNITVEGLWPIEREMPQKLKEESLSLPTYYVSYQPCVPCGVNEGAPASWPLVQIAKYRRGVGDAFFYVYKVMGK